MTFKTTKLRDAITFALVAGATAVAGTGVAFAQDADEQPTSQQATTLDRIEVTGSRIKRADIEGALPVVVIDRTAIEASGDVSVADFLRDTTFNSFGSYQSSSGSNWTGSTGINMRGLGEGRTLILIDGRRAPMGPNTAAGAFQDLNSIPLAAVERFEILSDGASAIYGSDALGGVVNIITRRDFEGIQISYGQGFPSEAGGDTQEGSILIGSAGDRGRLMAGVSYSNRDELYTRDRDFWMATRGSSVYSNNLLIADEDPTNEVYGWSPVAYMNHPEFGSAVPGDCTNGTNNFYTTGSGAGTRCQFDHKQQSANLTSLEILSTFVRGDHQINDDWMAFFNASVNRSESFGRYASVPSSPWPGNAIFLPVGSPNHPGNPDGYNAQYADQYDADNPYFMYHRFAALGPRDNNYENTAYDFTLGAEGTVGMFDVQAGVRYAESRAMNIGRNYVVAGLAQEQINNGNYNIYDPMNTPASVGNGMITTTARDMKTTLKEVFANVSFDLFEMAGGTSAAVLGAEYREDGYADIYDSLSEAGQVVGSSGNSAAGSRDLYAAYFEWLLPIVDRFEVNLAGRYDSYSDYGNDFSPKVSLRWQPLDTLTFRASYGEGFRAPGLALITTQPSFGALFVNHGPTCELQGITPPCETQITTYTIANPDLKSEQSEQFGLGVVWDATDWLNVGLDYYNIEITDSISSFSAAAVLNCLTGAGTLCPEGLSYFPSGTTVPNVGLGLGVTIDEATGGIVNGQAGYVNIGKVETEGYDLTVRTNFDLNNWGSMRNQLMVGYVSNYASNDARSIAGRPGYPRIRAGLTNQWSMNDWEFSWNISYIHRTQSQAFRTLLGSAQTDYGLPHHLPSYTLNDFQVTYRAPWNARISLGVQNAFDKGAVVDPYNEDFDSYLYNTWGRTPYFRYTQNF